MTSSHNSNVSLGVLAAFVAAWTIVWIGAGIWTMHEVQALRQLSDTVIQSGGAVKETGEALRGLRKIPFVGPEVDRVGRRVSATGVNAQISGRSSRSAVGHLAILLGLAVGLMPTVPMFALYLVAWRISARAKGTV